MMSTPRQLPRTKPVSSVKAREDAILAHVYVNQIRNNFLDIINGTDKGIIIPQGLFFDETIIQNGIDEMMDKLPPKTDITNVLESIRDFTSSNKIGEDIKTGIREAIAAFSDLTNKANKAIDSAHDILSGFGAGLIVFFLVEFLEKRTKKSALILIIVTFMLCFSDNPLNPMTLYQKILAHRFTEVFAACIGAFTPKKEEGEPVIVPQSFDSGSLYDVMIVGWLGYLGYNKTEIDKKRISQFSEALKMRSSLPQFLDSIKELMVKLYNDTIAEFFKLSKLPFTNFNDPYLVAFESDVAEVQEMIAHGKFAKSISNFAKIKSMHERAKALYKGIPTTRECESVRRIFIKNVDTLATIRKSFENANIHLNGYRIEPVGVLIRGSPGTHKSHVMSTLCATIAGIVLSPDDYSRYKDCPQNFEYNRQHETVYMDGYSPETITMTFDDLGQVRDVAGNPDTEFMNVVRFINSFEAMGHSAAMEQKGVMRIRPKFVLATTNMTRLSSNSINSISAVTRRFPISITVVPKPEYRKEGSTGIYDQSFDYSKIPHINVQGKEIADINSDCFLFYDCDTEGRTIGNPYSYNSLVERIMAAHYERVAWHEQHEKNFRDIADTYHNKYWNDLIEVQSGVFYAPTESNESIVSRPINGLRDLREFDSTVGQVVTQEDEYLRHTLDHRKRLITEYGLTDLSILEVVDQGPLDNLFDNYNVPQDLTDEFNRFWYDYSLIINKNKEWYQGFFGGNMYYKHLSIYEICYILYSLRKNHFLASVGTGRIVNDFEPFGEEILLMYKPTNTIVFTKMSDIISQVKTKVSQFLLYVSQTYLNPENFDKTMRVVNLVSLAVGCLLAYYVHKPKSTTTEIIPEGFYETQKGGVKVKNMTLRQLKESQSNHGITPQGSDITGFDLVNSITTKNLTRILVAGEEDEELKLLGYGILLLTNRIMMPLHFVERLLRAKSDDKEIGLRMVYFMSVGDENPVPNAQITINELINNCFDDGMEETHMVIVALPTRDCRNIVKSFFVTEKMVSNLSRQFHVSMKVPHRRVYVNSLAYKAEVPITDKHIHYTVTKGIRYYVDSMEGDCGVPIFVRNATMQAHRIIGAHIAGSSRSGDEQAYSSLVTQEMIEECLKSIVKQVKCSTQDLTHTVTETYEGLNPDIQLQSVPLFIADKYKVLGTVKETHSPYGISDIRKSRLQHPKGPFLSKMDVAMLRPTDGKDPYEIALKNYCSNSAILDSTLVRHCKDDFQAFLFSLPPGEKRILSIEESLWGDADKAFSDAIKSSTSAGYPMKYDKSNLKKRLFALDAPRDRTHPDFKEVEALFGKLIDDCRNNIRQLLIYTDNLKIERRKKQKVINGQSRLFSGAMFVYLGVFRMYFGAFMQWIHQNSIRNGMVTAINPFSMQWDQIAHNLRSTSTSSDPLVCDGDFSHYDGDQLTVFAFAVLDIVNAWYSDGNDQIRRILWLELVNSRHLFNNIVYEWFGALPSGNPFTLILNSMNNQLIHRYAFYSQLPTTLVFHKIVKLYCTGDDVIMAVIDEFKDRFNGIIVQEAMANIGYTYTSANKEDAIVPWKKLSEVQFLKRTFRWEKLISRYVGPLDINSVVEIPLWTKKHDALAITHSNINEYLDELSLHDDEVWDAHAPKFQHAVQVLFPEFSESEGVMDTRLMRFSRKIDAEVVVFRSQKRKLLTPTSSPQ